MTKRQLAALFICNLVPYVVACGCCGPLLPVYATRLGAGSTLAGLCLSFGYVATALGAISAAWVSRSRYRRKLPIVIAGLVSVPLTWLMGRANSVWALTLLFALLMLCTGLQLALISILAGMFAGENERGKIFGILALNYGMGSIVGGLGAGWLVENWGYSIMFSVFAVLWLLLPLAALFLEEKEDRKPQPEEPMPGRPAALGIGYYLLFAASVMTSVTIFFLLLVRSLVMDDLGFGPLEITSTGVVGGLICLPLPILVGWLSDRFGRKAILILGYLSAFPALILLAVSNSLWQFWLIFVFFGLFSEGNASIGPAWVTDLLPLESLGKGLSLYGSTLWIGGIIGGVLSGYLLESLGVVPTAVIGGLLALGAVGLLIPIKARVGQVRLSQA